MSYEFFLSFTLYNFSVLNFYNQTRVNLEQFGSVCLDTARSEMLSSWGRTPYLTGLGIISSI